jgi:hypothetical protein
MRILKRDRWLEQVAEGHSHPNERRRNPSPNLPEVATFQRCSHETLILKTISFNPKHPKRDNEKIYE